MKTVTLGVATLKDVKRRARDAFKGKKQAARISFATPELLFQLMTTKRWELIRTMAGAGPLTIRETARRVDRDVKGVHGGNSFLVPGRGPAAISAITASCGSKTAIIDRNGLHFRKNA